MKNIRAAIFMLFVIGLLLIAGYRTVAVTRTVASVTPVPLTPTPRMVYHSPSPMPTYVLSTPMGVIPPNANQQVYLDPAGWYAVNFPKEMHPTNKANLFVSAKGDRMETGYLPEAGYMTKITQVCTWLANIVLKQAKNTIWVYPDYYVTSEAADGSKARYTIYQNTEADPQHRYIYIKVSSASLSEAWDVEDRTTFTWLKPIAKTGPVATLSAEEAAFWNKAIPMPTNISLTEYDLPPGADAREDDMLLNFVSAGVWRRPAPTKGPSPTPTLSTKDMLENLGYQLTDRGQLYRNGKMLLDKVSHVSNLYTFPNASPPIKAVVLAVHDKSERDVLIQNDVMSTLLVGSSMSSMDPGIPPILYKGQLLWAKVGRDPHIEVKKSNGDVLYTFVTYYGATLPRISFQAWQGHWILEVSEFVIEDGEVLNTKLGFQEMFYWYLIHNKPLYFFRKGSRIGLSYDGQILPLQYEDVMRGGCCSMAANNPRWDLDNTVGFFAKRDGVWRYVVLKLN